MAPRIADVAATFQSHATGNCGQHVVEIFANDVDDNMDIVVNETSISDNESTDGDPTESTTTQAPTLTTWKTPHVERTQSTLQLHLEDDCRRRCERCSRVDTRVSIATIARSDG